MHTPVNIDTALQLRMRNDSGENISEEEVIGLLSASDLTKKLTSDFIPKPLFAIWRIIALSEIPFAGHLPHTVQVLEYIEQHLSTPYGFTLTGKADDLLPCYNAMLIEAYCKLGFSDSNTVRSGIDWIKKYQRFERNTPTLWKGKGIKKYGGCLEKTPCYIGVAKTIKALLHYEKVTVKEDKEIARLIARGIDYLLQHQLYKRLSTGEPISKYILTLSFPPSYQLNIVELLEIMHLSHNIQHPACQDGISYVMNKMDEQGGWRIDYAYRANGYMTFDRKGRKGDWITYLLDMYTGQP